jgi:PIN domain-containing protein
VRRHRLPEPFVFFVDECLGRHVVPDALRDAVSEGERVELRAQGTLDLDWIPAADAGGWACFTKDHELRRRPNELAALLGGMFAVFLLGEASGPEHAVRIVKALPVVRRVLRARDVPLIARVEADGVVVVVYEAGRRLDQPRRVKPKGS